MTQSEFIKMYCENSNITEEEYIKHPCPNCGTITIQPKWLLEKFKKEGDDVYCSEGCRYNAETGNSAEEY